jgi:hypothetical protein
VLPSPHGDGKGVWATHGFIGEFHEGTCKVEEKAVLKERVGVIRTSIAT